MNEGRRLKLIALDHLENATPDRQEWVAEGRRLAWRIARERGYVTSEMLRELHPVPEEWDARILGSCFQCTGLCKDGSEYAKRPQCHMRPIQRWVIANDWDQ